jgi:hypothetical protein
VASLCARACPGLAGWGVVKSLALRGCGPVVLVHTQKIGIQSEKPTWTKALEFIQFARPCGIDPRLLSGEQRTSHFKLVTSVDDPQTGRMIQTRDLGSGVRISWGALIYPRARHRDQQVPFLRNRFRKAEFTRPRYQSSGVSPAAPPHWIGTNRG